MFVSIRAKLGSVLFLSVFVLTLLIVSAQQYHSYLNFKKYVRSTSETAVKVAIDLSDKWINERMNLAQVAAYRVEKSIASGADIRVDLSDFAAQNHLTGAYYGDDSGASMIRTGSWEPTDGFNYKERPWYSIAKQGKNAVFVPPYEDARTGEMTVSFAAPVYDNERWRLKGVVGYDVLFDELNAVVGSIFVAPVEKLIPFKLKDGRLGVLVKTQGMRDEDGQEVIRRAQSGDPGALQNFKTSDEQYMLVSGQLQAVNGLMIYPIAMKSLIRPLLLQAAAYFAITAGFLWLIVNIAWLLLGRYIRRIERLSGAAQAVAEGKFETEVPGMPDDEIGRLGGAFNKMVQDLRQYMKTLEVTAREKESIAKELQIAAQLQEKALPRQMPEVPGLEVSAKSFPAKAVGGDYYDFVYPGKDTVGFVIADAAGKGFPGSLYMSTSRSIFRVISQTETSPSVMLRKTNDYISGDPTQEGMFITYIYCVYDGAARRLTYSNAGHFPPLLYNTRTKVFKALNAGGMPIGIMAGADFPEEMVEFAEGDLLVLYTDGIIEAMNLQNEMFGVEKLEELIRNHGAEPTRSLIEHISAQIAGFVGEAPQHDDMTIVVIKAR
jgi:serine phosphatase RsbU (regulator of sigma subunit)